MALPTRTVYLAPSLTKANLLAAHRARHFYATEDPNAQLVFRTSDGAHVMGDIFNAAGGATLVANLYDPDGEVGLHARDLARPDRRRRAGLAVRDVLESVVGDAHRVAHVRHLLLLRPRRAGRRPRPLVRADVDHLSGRRRRHDGAHDVDHRAARTARRFSGTTNVTANASDNVGVTRVEFFLDGALQSTDTTSPYAWSWNTTGASNGAHALTSQGVRRREQHRHVGRGERHREQRRRRHRPRTSRGWKITQANATYEYILPAGTTIPADGYLVVARQADKAAFQTFWGVTLGANVIFLNSAGGMPVINGDENYTLRNAPSVRRRRPERGAARVGRAQRAARRSRAARRGTRSLEIVRESPAAARARVAAAA